MLRTSPHWQAASHLVRRDLETLSQPRKIAMWPRKKCQNFKNVNVKNEIYLSFTQHLGQEKNVFLIHHCRVVSCRQHTGSEIVSLLAWFNGTYVTVERSSMYFRSHKNNDSDSE
jgi:hypothetical protein